MFRVISRKRLIVTGAIATVTAAGAGGTVLAARSASSPATVAQQSPQSSASPSASPGAPAERGKKHEHGAGFLHLGKVTQVSATSITVVDAAGKSTTYALSPKTKIVTFNHQTEAATAIPVGELVVVFAGHPHAGGKGQAAGPTPTPAQPEQPVAVAIEDTGFKAA